MKSNHDSIRRVLTTVHCACLSIACGIVVATGVAAAIAFPTMRDMNPRFSDLAALDDQWMIAAGSIMARVFAITAMIAGGFIAVAVLAYIAQFLRESRRAFGATLIRTLLLAGLVGVFVHYAGFLLPEMNETFHALLDAGRANEIESVGRLREEFESMHPAASRDLTAVAILTFLCALFSAWPLHRPGSVRS